MQSPVWSFRNTGALYVSFFLGFSGLVLVLWSREEDFVCDWFTEKATKYLHQCKIDADAPEDRYHFRDPNCLESCYGDGMAWVRCIILGLTCNCFLGLINLQESFIVRLHIRSPHFFGRFARRIFAAGTGEAEGGITLNGQSAVNRTLLNTSKLSIFCGLLYLVRDVIAETLHLRRRLFLECRDTFKVEGQHDINRKRYGVFVTGFAMVVLNFILMIRNKWVLRVETQFFNDQFDEGMPVHRDSRPDLSQCYGMKLLDIEKKEEGATTSLEFVKVPPIQSLSKEAKRRFWAVCFTLGAMFTLSENWLSCWACLDGITLDPGPGKNYTDLQKYLDLLGGCGRPSGIGALCCYAAGCMGVAGFVQVVILICPAQKEQVREEVSSPKQWAQQMEHQEHGLVLRFHVLSDQVRRAVQNALGGKLEQKTVRSHVWMMHNQVWVYNPPDTLMLDLDAVPAVGECLQRGELFIAEEESLMPDGSSFLRLGQRWIPKEHCAPSRMIGLSEVARHNRKDDVWVVVDGTVVDVTRWLPDHPGGQMAIMAWAGKKAPQEWRLIHATDTLLKYRRQVTICGKLSVVGDCAHAEPQEKRTWRRSAVPRDVRLTCASEADRRAWRDGLQCGGLAPSVCVEVDAGAPGAEEAPPEEAGWEPETANAGLLTPLLQRMPFVFPSSSSSPTRQCVQQIVPEEFLEGLVEFEIHLGRKWHWEWFSMLVYVVAIFMVVVDLMTYVHKWRGNVLSECSEMHTGYCWDQIPQDTGVELHFTNSTGPLLAVIGLGLASVSLLLCYLA